MEQTNTPQQPSRKKAILSLLVLLALTCVVVFIFSSHWSEISTALAQLSLWQVLLVLAIGLTYPLLEGIVCWLIIRCRLPGFTLRRGMDAAFVGIFGNVVGLGAGAVPMESYYLYHCGLPLGPGVADDPAICISQDHRSALCHCDAPAAAPLARRQHLRRDALSARRLLRGGAGHRGAGAALCLAAGAAAGPLGHGLSAQNGTMADPPGKVAGAAGHSGCREPPPAGRQGAVPASLPCRPSSCF